MEAADLNFSWVVEGKLAGCAGPVLEADLTFLVSRGVKALVRLAHDEEGTFEEKDIVKLGIEDCHVAVRDFSAPTQEQIERVIRFICSCLDRGKSVAVSCGAGRGRTGTVLCCYFVSRGSSAIDAVAEVRRRGRKPYETKEQLKAIEEYERLTKTI